MKTGLSKELSCFLYDPKARIEFYKKMHSWKNIQSDGSKKFIVTNSNGETMDFKTSPKK